jgi:hypothetical protein
MSSVAYFFAGFFFGGFCGVLTMALMAVNKELKMRDEE